MSELRQKKFARTRLALATALSAALAERSLHDISVKALCYEAEVSEATFFNYFPGKQDLMGYLAQLWLLELGWQAARAAQAGPGLSAVQQLFAHSARTCARRPGLMRELIAWLVHGGAPDAMQQPGEFELKLAFPELEGIEKIPLKGIDALIMPQLEAAIRSGELPDNTLIPTLLSLLLAILFGVPLTLLSRHPGKIADLYQQQLQLVWSGVRAAAGGPGQ
ncbi:MAG: TetR/AcrR family transcriptional regulator [Thiogranum sp.]